MDSKVHSRKGDDRYHMNKRIANPMIVHFMANTQERKPGVSGRKYYIPANCDWKAFSTLMQTAIQGNDYDSVVVYTDTDIDLDAPGICNSLTIKTNAISKLASEKELPVLSNASKSCWYFLNPSWEDQSKAGGYAPADQEVLDKFLSYESEAKWQEHQAGIWKRMADMMPLSTKAAYGTPNHLEMLTNPKRGLEKQDLSEFWSFKSGRVLNPSLMGDDMVGMPGVDGKQYDGFSIVTQSADGTIKEQPLMVRSLKTVGMSGAAIPMANPDGNVPKYQIATDPSVINTRLKARAKDGVSIQQSEYFDKKRNVFKFQFQDGTASELRVAGADANGTVVFSDKKGTFKSHLKADVTQVLKDRDYNLPDLIDSLIVEPSAKYIWQSRGTMAGSEETFKVVSPSNAGFVKAREPKNECKDYVVLVTEGALKGRIVAKYADVVDETGQSFGDLVAGDSGILVAQVPGVSRQFVESVKPIYKKYPVRETVIAMDADGRQNRSVADGIATAYACLKEKNPVTVMSWNPEQKGLDDALLAVAQKRITLADMGIQYGTPEELFPKKGTKRPNPYRLNGSRANRQEWQINYTKDAKLAAAKIKSLQEETKRRAAEALGVNTYTGEDTKTVGEELTKTVTELTKDTTAKKNNNEQIH